MERCVGMYAHQECCHTVESAKFNSSDSIKYLNYSSVYESISPLKCQIVDHSIKISLFPIILKKMVVFNKNLL
jgi:hypothetical protein